MKIAEREMEELSMKKRVGLLVVLLALVIMGSTMSVEAAEIIDRGYCGEEGNGKNLTWTLDRDGELVIEGQGKMKDWTWEESDPLEDNYRPTDWHKYYENIYSVIIQNGVMSIGEYAFCECISLSDITLPDTLASIGCSSLSNIVMSDMLASIGDGAFGDCSSLSSIALPDTLISIGDDAFRDCSSLSSIVLPKALTSIGDSAFLGCSSLSSITRAWNF